MTTETVTQGEKKFEYGYAKVKDMVCHTHAVAGDAKRGKRQIIDAISIDGRRLRASKRFWTSIQCRFGFSPNVFRYFDHKEVFDRISERVPNNDQVRYCIESDSDKESRGTLLAVTNPNNGTIRADRLNDLLSKYGVKNITYSNGIVRSTHTPRVGGSPFKIAGDEFINQFVADTPIDGFGRPNIYLSMLRMVCSNGAIGYGKAFRSEIAGGRTDDEMGQALVRAIEGFNNEDGYAAMRDRFNSATHSWASVNECQRLYKLLAGLANGGALEKQGREVAENGDVVETASPIFHKFHKMSGDVNEIYGISNLESLSTKRQRMLPAACTVYDLLNFATEMASHRSHEFGSRKLQAYVGDIISNEYDLEGTVDKFSDFRDFFIGDADAAETVQLLQQKQDNAGGYGRMRMSA